MCKLYQYLNLGCLSQRYVCIDMAIRPDTPEVMPWIFVAIEYVEGRSAKHYSSGHD